MTTFMKIEGFPGYEVSEDGQVRSNKRGKAIIMSPVRRSKKNPRLYVMLRKDNKSHPAYVSTLVAEAFLPNPNGLKAVGFKDGDLTNNDVSNLEWITKGEANRRGRKDKPNADCGICGEDGIHQSGLCKRHYAQAGQRKYRANRAQGGVANPRTTKAVVGYAAAHHRVTSHKGSASGHNCDCGVPAEGWSLQATAKTLYRESGTRYAGMLYSLNVDDYKAMCDKCHGAYDTEHREAMQERFNESIEVARTTNYRTELDIQAIVQAMVDGASLDEVAQAHDIHISYISRIVKSELGMNIRDWRTANKAGVV